MVLFGHIQPMAMEFAETAPGRASTPEPMTPTFYVGELCPALMNRTLLPLSFCPSPC